MNTTRALLVPVLILALGAARASAQGPPTLDQVEELARLGRTEEARALVSEWWRTVGPKASRRDTQRALWLRGQLTTDAGQAVLDFNRLVVEYPGGPWSDLALLRLAQAAYAAGDSAEAAARVARLVQEYPTSPVRSEAEAWLATAGPVPTRPPDPAAAGGVAADTAVRRSGGDPPGVPLPSGEVPAPAGGGEFTIQVGAFSTAARAEALLKQLSDAGFEGRLVRVPGNDLVRIRVGRFDSVEGAQAILWRIRDRGFTATMARDAHREEAVIR